MRPALSKSRRNASLGRVLIWYHSQTIQDRGTQPVSALRDVTISVGCAGVNGHFWVFAAATTNVEYTLRVTDGETGEERGYFNPLGTSAEAITDTGAFASCP